MNKKPIKNRQIPMIMLIVVNCLIILSIVSFIFQLHNIDMSFNFIKNDSNVCDYINNDECKDLKELYIDSFYNVRLLFLSVAICLMVFSNILLIKYERFNQ